MKTVFIVFGVILAVVILLGVHRWVSKTKEDKMKDIYPFF